MLLFQKFYAPAAHFLCFLETLRVKGLQKPARPQALPVLNRKILAKWEPGTMLGGYHLIPQEKTGLFALLSALLM